MSLLEPSLQVVSSIAMPRGETIVVGHVAYMHPYDLCILKGGIPELIRWMGERAERRIEALIEGRPLPAWPA